MLNAAKPNLSQG